MADLLTHYTTGRLFALGQNDVHTRLMFILGTVWPDLLHKVLYYLTRSKSSFCYPTHSLLGLLIACYVLSLFFQESRRQRYFIALMLGSILHVGVDMFKDDIGHGETFFYPFSTAAYELGLYQPENIVFAMPVAMVLLLITLWIERLIHGKPSLR